MRDMLLRQPVGAGAGSAGPWPGDPGVLLPATPAGAWWDGEEQGGEGGPARPTPAAEERAGKADGQRDAPGTVLSVWAAPVPKCHQTEELVAPVQEGTCSPLAGCRVRSPWPQYKAGEDPVAWLTWRWGAGCSPQISCSPSESSSS